MKINLLVGSFEEEGTIAAAEFANEMKIPFIYTSDGTLKTCRAGAAIETSDYVWGVGLTNYMSVEPFLVYLSDKLSKPEAKFKVFFFGTQQEGSGTGTNAEFLQQASEDLEFESAGEDYIDARVQDYFQRIRQIFPTRPDLLLLSVSRPGMPRFMQQSQKLGVRAEMAVATSENLEEEVVAGLAGTADGLYTVARYSSHLDNPKNKEFLQAWKQLYPDPLLQPTSTAVAAYSALLLAKAGFDKAGSPEPAAFAKAMNDLEIDLPQGRVVVNNNHLLIQPLYAVSIKNNAYDVAEYLGDVSHPGMEACTIPQPVEDQPKDEAPQRDHYEGNSDSPYGEGGT